MNQNKKLLNTHPGSPLPSLLFSDVQQKVSSFETAAMTSRCLYCYDAPCTEACPTDIQVPEFIRSISTGNMKGAALEILNANPMGGTCSRVCPVESLCEKACVKLKMGETPVEIGRLQRLATDWYFANPSDDFIPEPDTGRKVAVAGAGPAGLSCAFRLAMLGHQVDIFEARAKGGGLNEYGIAPYKMTENWAARELRFLISLPGIRLHTGRRLGKDIHLKQLRQDYDAVFLGTGLSGSNQLGIADEGITGVRDAVDYIAKLRQDTDPATSGICDHVLVAGGGSTAIDIACQMKMLGAKRVTIACRRGKNQMRATDKEQKFAEGHGVSILPWTRVLRLISDQNGCLTGCQMEPTRTGAGDKLERDGDPFFLPADLLFKAIGQHYVAQDSGFTDSPEFPDCKAGKIYVDKERKTSLEGVWAGGDCTGVSEDLTVWAVQDGKIAAASIHSWLSVGQRAMKESEHG